MVSTASLTDDTRLRAALPEEATYSFRSRIAAATLALSLGSFGLHRFFLGQWWGVLYLLFCWTLIPWVVSAIEAIVFLTTPQVRWNERYNPGSPIAREKGGGVLFAAMLIPVIALLIGFSMALPAYHDYESRLQQLQQQSLGQQSIGR